MTHADAAAPAARCAPTPTPARTPPGPGASAPQGIGLCRTEHMFLGDRRELVERLILARTDAERAGRAGRAAAVAAGRLRRDLPGDGRPAGHRPADRPAAARVPAAAGGAGGERRGRPGARRGRRPRTRRCWPRYAGCTSRTRCSGLRGVRLGLVIPGLFAMQVRAIAEAAVALRPRRAATRAGDHGAAGRRRAGAGDGTRGGRADHRRGGRGQRRRGADRHDDRGAAGGADRRADRRGGRVLLLRHQRPDPDGLGLLPRRRRGRVLLALPGAGHLRRLAVRVDRPRRRRPAGPDRRRGGPRRPART